MARADAAFHQAFGSAPTHVVQAPGRVNLIGEHTDYNDGFVFPCAINVGTWIVCRARTDANVRVVAADMQYTTDTFDLDAPITPRTENTWANYVRGMVVEMHRLFPQMRGADLAIAGNVPQGAGLSSSASLEVAVGRAFAVLHTLSLTSTPLALAAQRAENDFVGCQCGIMDQLISASAQHGHASLIDCRTLDIAPVALPDDTAVLIVHSGIKRGLVASEYNQRRAQCEAMAAHLGVAALRDASLTQIMEAANADPTTRRRARHVVSENARTLAAADALRTADLRRFGELMAASHRSMRDDFEITLPGIDRLVAILQAAIGEAGGARMTGGGFGGCVVAVMPSALLPQALNAVAAHYRTPDGARAAQYVCRASAGVHEVKP